LTGGIEGKWG